MIRAALAAVLALAWLPAALAQAVVITQPFGTTTAQVAGTITLGGTFQTALAASANRKGCLIQNTSSNTLYVYFGASTPTLLNSIQVAPTGFLTCASITGIVLTGAVQVTTSTTADAYVVASQ